MSADVTTVQRYLVSCQPCRWFPPPFDSESAADEAADWHDERFHA